MRAESAIFAALGDDTRLSLVDRLHRDGPASIVDLTAGTGLTRQAVTKHLVILEKAGLLHSRRFGRATLWQADTQALIPARDCLDQISRRWDDRLDRLRSHVET